MTTRTILLATDDGRDPAYGEMREPVLRWAASQEARVVLYDRSAESYFVDPYPSGPWTADVEGGPDRRSLLDPRQLEMLGRHYLAEQVRSARGAGVEAGGWLPSRPGSRGMADAVSDVGADLVIMPASVARPSLLDRVRGNTLAGFREALSVPVAVADRSGISTDATVSAG
jgi:hypothetical protein